MFVNATPIELLKHRIYILEYQFSVLEPFCILGRRGCELYVMTVTAAAAILVERGTCDEIKGNYLSTFPNFIIQQCLKCVMYIV